MAGAPARTNAEDTPPSANGGETRNPNSRHRPSAPALESGARPVATAGCDPNQ